MTRSMLHAPFVALVAGGVAAMLLTLPAAAQQGGSLPEPHKVGGMPLMEAIAKRQSTRAFAPRPLPAQTLSNLLWAAYGINRAKTGDLTVPSWRGSKEMDIYVVTPEGVAIYDRAKHALRSHLSGDIREHVGRQPFAATAPLALVYVADRKRMAEAPEADQTLNAHVDAAFIGQNVYLFAASEGLGTVFLGNVEKPDLAKALKLRPDQVLTFSQLVGFPK